MNWCMVLHTNDFDCQCKPMCHCIVFNMEGNEIGGKFVSQIEMGITNELFKNIDDLSS